MIGLKIFLVWMSLILMPVLLQASNVACRIAVQKAYPKQQYLEQLAERTSLSLFQSETIFENPEQFKNYLKILGKTNFKNLNEEKINRIVDFYLRDLLTEYQTSRSETSISSLTKIYTDRLVDSLKHEGLEVEKSRTYFNNFFRIGLWASISSALALKFQIFVPVYLPALKAPNIEFSPQQIEIILRLPPSRAIHALQQIEPNLKAFDFYHRVRRSLLKWMLVFATVQFTFSDLGLHYVDTYTPFGAPAREVKASAQLTWNQVFSDKKKMQDQVLAIQMHMMGIDPSNQEQIAKLQKQVESMHFEQMSKFLD